MSPAPDVVLATCSELPAGDADTALLARHLEGSGVRADVIVWNDSDVDWAGAPPTVIRSTWDYHKCRDAFVEWAQTVPVLHNCSALVEWNTDKRYLLDLPATLPTVPTRVVEDGRPRAVLESMKAEGWEDAVVKPVVGLDGHGVRRVSTTRPLEADLAGPWLLQPFLEEAASGEVSVVVVDGEPTHAVIRHPPRDDFRAQERLGGRVEQWDATAEVLQLARSAVSWIKPRPLYARVDLVRREGRWVIMELELVEPSLFLTHAQEALHAMSDAILRLVLGG